MITVRSGPLPTSIPVSAVEKGFSSSVSASLKAD
jgi:hypothetical protein